MNIKKLLITGDRLFINRHAPLFAALAGHYRQLDYLIGDEPYPFPWLNRGIRVANKFLNLLSKPLSEKRHKNSSNFIYRSRQLQKRIEHLPETPDFVLHVFGLYCPFWEPCEIPYGMYLDYTMALASRHWPAWAPFANQQELQAWQDCERSAYCRALHLFTMSKKVKLSLVQDYGIAPEKITVVGSFAGRHQVYEGEKPFGSKQILFNGGDFERKGGDLVLAAFERIQPAIPEAKLVVVGKKLNPRQQGTNHSVNNGVMNLGRIGTLTDMRELFLHTDIVVAPGRCDPFPTFVIEAMNYGVPCIVSDQDGMPEIVDHGTNGLVLNSPTPETMAAAINRLMGDLNTLNSMSQQARKKIAEQFNDQVVAQKITQSILSL